MTNKGKLSVANEVLTVSLTCLVLAVILLHFVLKNTKVQQFNTLKSNIDLLQSSANVYSLENSRSIISLKELVDEGFIAAIKDPFNPKEYCDLYESKIQYTESATIATLECGNYLITSTTANSSAIIYYVSEWSEENKKNSYIKMGYNYLKNNLDAYPDYYEEATFLYLFNKENSTNYKSISSIPYEYNVKSKILYRKMTKVKEF